MAHFSRAVKLLFVDQRTGEVFAETDIDLDRLPDTFEVNTRLHIGDQTWQVMGAEPETKAEFAIARRLTLWLLPTAVIDSLKILHSTATISDDLPILQGAGSARGVHRLHEDDWRQIELIERIFSPVIEAEIDSVLEIHRNARCDAGFERVHVRKRIPRPISEGVLYLSELTERLSEFGRSLPCAVGSEGSSPETWSPVIEGFAFRFGEDFAAHGCAPQGNVAVLSLVGRCRSTKQREAFRSLAEEKKLLLVDWCRCRIAAPDDPLFEGTLNGEA